MKETDLKLFTLDCGYTEKEYSAEERSFTQYISTKTLDRGKDIVIPNGMNDKAFAKNPIVLFNHDTNRPVARSLWRKPDEKGVLAKTAFSKTEFADDIHTLYLEGVLNAWSIGFMPKDWTYDKDKGVTTFNKWEMFEYSSVSLPMNPEALNEAKSMVKGAEGLFVVKSAQAEYSIRESLNSMDSVDALSKKMGELEILVKSSQSDESLINEIEKLETEVAKLKSQLENFILSNKLTNKISAEALDINAKKIVNDLFVKVV